MYYTYAQVSFCLLDSSRGHGKTNKYTYIKHANTHTHFLENNFKKPGARQQPALTTAPHL